MNKLRITLNEDGSVVQFAPDFKIIRGSYYDVLINIEVPHSLLVDPVTDTGDGSGATGNNVRVGGLISTANGRILQTKRYEFQYVKDFERAGISYKLYQRKMPKEFTMWETVCENEMGENGSLKLVINVVNWTLNDLEAKVEEVSASPAFYLDIYPSEYLTEEEEIESPSDFATLQSQVQDIATDFTTLKTDLYTESGDGLGDYLKTRLAEGNKIVLTQTDNQIEIAVDTLYASDINLEAVDDLDADNLQTALEEISRRFDSKSVDTLTGEDEGLVDNTDPNNPVILHDATKVDVTTFDEAVEGLNSAISTNAEGISELNTNLASYSLINDTGAKIDLDIDTTNYIMTLALKNATGETLSTQTIDFPLESMVVGASYKNGTLTLTLQNGTALDIDISSIIDGLVSETDFNELKTQVETNTGNIASNAANISTNAANISSNVSAISAETAERKSGDEALQEQISSNDDDIAALQSADTTLQSNIDAEAEARENAVDALQSQITTNTTNIATNTNDISALKTQVDTNKTNIEALTNGVDLSALQTQVTTNATAISTLSSTDYADETKNNIVHKSGEETITGEKSFDAPINSSVVSNRYVEGNQGNVIINSTAEAGAYTMLDKLNSTSGYFTDGVYKGNRQFNYTTADTVTAGTNARTYYITLLDESGRSSFRHLLPLTSSTYYLGTSTYPWKELHLSGDANVGNLYVSGDIVQEGDTYVTEAEHLKVEDSLIFTRNGATTKLQDGEYTGLIASHYDEDGNYGALIYDNAGVARVGDVTITEETDDEGNTTRSIDASSAQPLATRAEADDMTDTGLVSWDATNEKLVTDAGIKTSDVVTLSGEQTITGAKTFTALANQFTSSSFPHISGNGTRLCLSNNSSWNAGTYVFEGTVFRPSNDRTGAISFGTSAAKWKDLYLSGNANVGGTITATTFSGNLTDGTNTITATDVTNKPGLIVTDADTGNVGEIFNDYKNNVASGNYSHAGGHQTTASGGNSHAEGYLTTASGGNSHAEGCFTTASGGYSHAEGCGTFADQNFQTAVGKYNLTGQSGSLFAVGNGSSTARSNAFEVFQDGHVEVSGGTITYDASTDTFSI